MIKTSQVGRDPCTQTPQGDKEACMKSPPGNRNASQTPNTVTCRTRSGRINCQINQTKGLCILLVDWTFLIRDYFYVSIFVDVKDRLSVTCR